METAHRQESPPRAQGAGPARPVWKDEQLVKREEVREGKSFPGRKGGLVKAELRSHRRGEGTKQVTVVWHPVHGNMDRQCGWSGRSQEAGQTTCSLDALPGLSSVLLWSYPSSPPPIPVP